MNTIALIPARLNSTRLPGKILLDIAGKPLIQRVYEQVVKSKSLSGVFIAVDDETTYNTISSFTENVIMTSPHHATGTDRLAEAARILDCDNVINVQGDEPLINPLLIDSLAKALETDEMVSAMRRITDQGEIENPSVVKVLTSKDGYALYFSRYPIPYDRDDTHEGLYYHHIGIYGYSRELLLKYPSLEKSAYEKMEKLEQLRALYHRIPIKMIETEDDVIGVDTLEELLKVREIFLKREKE